MSAWVLRKLVEREELLEVEDDRQRIRQQQNVNVHHEDDQYSGPIVDAAAAVLMGASSTRSY